MSALFRAVITSPNGREDASRPAHLLTASIPSRGKVQSTQWASTRMQLGDRLWLEELDGKSWRRIAYRETRPRGHGHVLTSWQTVRQGR